MRTMTRRLAALAIVAIVSLTACRSGDPISRPTDLSAPTAVQTPLAAPTASVVPTANCGSGGAGVADAFLTIWTLESIEEIGLQPAIGLPTVAPAATIDPNEVPVIASVLGGTPVETVLSAEAGAGPPPSVSSVTADFVPFGSGTALEVEATVNGASVLLRLPDADARGTLRIAIAWTTVCGSAEAAGEMALRVFDSSVAAGCPTSEDGLIGSMTSLADESFQYGTVDVPFAIVGWSGRWILANGETDAPQFEPWDRDAVIPSAPGESIVVRHAVDHLQLLSVRTGIFQRAVVEGYLEPDSTTELTIFGSDRTNAGSRGRVSVPAPIEAGRYVFESLGTWQTPCLNLVTYSVVSVDVR